MFQNPPLVVCGSARTLKLSSDVIPCRRKVPSEAGTRDQTWDLHHAQKTCRAVTARSVYKNFPRVRQVNSTMALLNGALFQPRMRGQRSVAQLNDNRYDLRARPHSKTELRRHPESMDGRLGSKHSRPQLVPLPHASRTRSREEQSNCAQISLCRPKEGKITSRTVLWSSKECPPEEV